MSHDHAQSAPTKAPLYFGRLWPRFLGLRFRFLASFLILALAPMAILHFMHEKAYRRDLTEAAYRSLLASAGQSASALDAFIAHNEDVIGAEAMVPVLATFLASPPEKRRDKEFRTQVLGVLNSFRHRDMVFISSYGLVDVNGTNVIDTVPENVGMDLSNREYVKNALLSGLPFCSAVEFSQTDGQPHLYFAAPVFDRGALAGLLRARYSAAALQQLAINDAGLAGSLSFPIIVDENGFLLANGQLSHHTAPDVLFRPLTALNADQTAALHAARRLPPTPPVPLENMGGELARGLAKAGGARPYFRTDFLQPGNRMLAAAAARLQRQRWVVAFFQPEEVFLAPLRAQTRDALVLVACIAGLAALAAIVAARFLAGPVTRLTEAAQKVAEADFSAMIPVESRDEIGLLAQTFNFMTERLRMTMQGLKERVEELKRAEQAYRSSEEKYRGIVEHSIEGIFQATPEGRFLSVNPAAARFMGRDAPEELLEEIKDIRSQMFVDPERYDHYLDMLRAGKTVIGFEARFRRRDNSVRWGILNARPVFDEEGRLLYTEGMVDDITERKWAEEELAGLNRHLEELVEARTIALRHKAEELAEANVRLLELDELKSAFLSSVSHELRTPLTSVLGFAKLIDKDFEKSFLPLIKDDATLTRRGLRIRENIAIIIQEGVRLTRLINDVLDLSRIESGKVPWSDAEIDVAQLAARAADAVKGQLEHKHGLRLVTRLAPNLPGLRIDPDRLEQVLINLLDNAIKFTSQGEIVLEIPAPEKDRLLIKVSDAGIGVRSDSLEMIFDKFYQVTHKDTLKDKPHGSGLGLAICRQIVEHYGGRIWVESEKGRGSVFSVMLPLVSKDHAAT